MLLDDAFEVGVRDGMKKVAAGAAVVKNVSKVKSVKTLGRGGTQAGPGKSRGAGRAAGMDQEAAMSVAGTSAPSTAPNQQPPRPMSL